MKAERAPSVGFLDTAIACDQADRPVSVDVGDARNKASEYVLEYSPALGDSFAAATTEDVEATLLVGGDDYDEISDVPMERLRERAA